MTPLVQDERGANSSRDKLFFVSEHFHVSCCMRRVVSDSRPITEWGSAPKSAATAVRRSRDLLSPNVTVVLQSVGEVMVQTVDEAKDDGCPKTNVGKFDGLLSTAEEETKKVRMVAGGWQVAGH